MIEPLWGMRAAAGRMQLRRGPVRGAADGHRGGQPERLKSEAAFAMLCGVAPVPVSSGMTYRHRLNRGRRPPWANSAIHIIAIGRLRTDQRTQDYVAKKLAEGHTKMEALRCLKRYIARGDVLRHKKAVRARKSLLTLRGASRAGSTSR